MMRSHFRYKFLLASLFALLAGCGNESEQEIRQWMDETKKSTKVFVPKLTEPKKFVPFVYGGANEVDPYNPSKLLVALAKLKSLSSNSLKPDLERRREPLEAFPLDTLRMVGTLQKPGLNYALVQVDKTVYQVKVGNYVGQNLGMVTNVSENEVDIKETVQDASGEWVERQAKLGLQESKK